MDEQLVCFYRISDCFQDSSTGAAVFKARPGGFDKRKCLLNFLSVFGEDHVVIIADQVGKQTLEWLHTLVPDNRIVTTTYKSGAFSFLHAARLAAKLPGEVCVYLCEDDYLHTADARTCLLEGLSIGDYVTTYDHPDKYVDSGTVDGAGCRGNPLVANRSECTRVYRTQSVHWKETNSTTMTFAARARTIQKDLDVYVTFCRTGYPYDYAMFRHLVPPRKLVSSLPGKSTHCESVNMSPMVDWETTFSVSPRLPDGVV